MSWLTSATIIKDVVYEMHFPYRLEGVGGNLETAVVAQGQKSFTYSWPANDSAAIRSVVFHARAWDGPAIMGGIAGVLVFPWMLFMVFKMIWQFLKQNIFIGAVQTAATVAGKTTRAVFRLPGKVWMLFKKKQNPEPNQVAPPPETTALLPPPEDKETK